MPTPALRRTGALATAVALALMAALPPAAEAAAGTNFNKWARQAEFVRAMKAATAGDPDFKVDARRRMREARKEEMYRNMLAKAVPRPTAAKTVDAAAAPPDFMMVPTAASRPHKKEGAQQQQQQRGKQHRELEDGNQNGDDEEEMEWGAFGFDPSEFSIKYTACSAISFYSDEMAEENGNGNNNNNNNGNGDGDGVTMSTKFVVFRLCPTEYCSNYAANGCGANYGEYLIPLNVYVEEFSRYKEEMSDAYCEYCEQCMYFEKYFYGNRDLAGDDDADGAYGDDAAGDDAAGDDAAGDDAAAEEESHACKYYDECSTYLDVCDGAEEEGDDANGDDGDDEVEIEYDRYFECQQWDGGNNNNNNNNNNGNNYYNKYLYIGPHCNADGYTIEFGVFSDEYCSQYVGNQYSLEDVTGIEDFGADYMGDFAKSDCISCKESELPYMIPQGDEEDEDDITELCEGLYEQSAKCNVNLFDAEDESYGYQNQESNEELVCSFIQNVLNGAYDENGYVILDEAEGGSGVFNFVSGAAPSIGQIFGMLGLMIGCATLMVIACFMHRSIGKYNELKQRSALVPPEQEISRAESGVMVGRSFSRDYPDGTYVMS